MTRHGIGNAHMGLLAFMAAEIMLFAGLVSAYLIYRTGSPDWPPPALPRLPLGVTAVNTAVLLSSGIAAQMALRAMRRGRLPRAVARLWATALLGMAFLGVQGFEWARLIRAGLTLQEGVYGATFFTLIGLHAAHVAGAAVWLCVVLGFASAGRCSDRALSLCVIYWTFVAALWPALFVLVYLPWGH